MSGITLYEPDELILSARAGTPLSDILDAISEKQQELAFEPPDLSALMGVDGDATIGGVIAANLAGPRRLKSGAARDHFLGFTAVTGRAEEVKSGGRVMKNVTGYDLPKVLAGSWGTLGVMTDVTIKVLPAAETQSTLLIPGLDAETAVAAMSAAMKSSCEVSGAAFVPEVLTSKSARSEVNSIASSATLLRVEGIPPSVDFRMSKLHDLLEHRGPDDQGVYVNCSAALGQRRLSIIDLTSGQQPMSNEDGTVWLTFNGEIYNYRELRKELIGPWPRDSRRTATRRRLCMRTRSTETTVCSICGECSLSPSGIRGSGDCCWRGTVRARNRCSTPPLAGSLCSRRNCSRWRVIQGFQRDISARAVDDFLTYGYVPPPGSIFRGVHKLPPGCVLTLTPETAHESEPQIRRYWQLEYSPKLRFRSENDALDALHGSSHRSGAAAHDIGRSSWEPC